MRTPERYGETKDNWNGLLQKAMEVFVTAHSDATVLFFSSSETFTKLMDKPSLYGFSPEAVQEFGGTMWRDHVHPTSRVHDLLASDIAEFLNGA
jgi:phospholipase/lecithinase/hemolysin